MRYLCVVLVFVVILCVSAEETKYRLRSSRDHVRWRSIDPRISPTLQETLRLVAMLGPETNFRYPAFGSDPFTPAAYNHYRNRNEF
ncbi:uncharacterized protein G2W53_001876 [Senna tora]|uniref:Uncharacterized protein n=1 Tax=Senna tora TaxID=362788 RepID=A0A834XJG5_9FABA|nr:uncharacterized protein G2W53_001876 [Senna tora]